MSLDKGVLRQAARRTRRALHAAAPDAGARAAAAFQAAALTRPHVAGLYWPAGSEIDPRPLGAVLAGAGTNLSLPGVAAADQALVFRAWSEGDALGADALGLAAPHLSALIVRPDLLVVPLLAFDGFGARLGQGGGYYDRTIAQLRVAGPVFVLGLAYAGQETDRLPAEAHDQPLDAVLTETGLRLFG